jgi:hypothetical protein
LVRLDVSSDDVFRHGFGVVIEKAAYRFKVAREHRSNATLLFKWCRYYQAVALNAPKLKFTTLLPVAIVDAADAAQSKAGKGSRKYSLIPTAPVASSAGIIEIKFPAAVVRIDGCVDPAALSVVLQSLRS